MTCSFNRQNNSVIYFVISLTNSSNCVNLAGFRWLICSGSRGGGLKTHCQSGPELFSEFLPLR